MTLEVGSREGRARIRVKVQARARREEIAGVHNGALRVRVTAPPLEGRANQAVVALLAEQLRVPRSSVRIVGGERSSLKWIEVAGLDAAALLERLRLEPARRSRSGGGSASFFCLPGLPPGGKECECSTRSS